MVFIHLIGSSEAITTLCSLSVDGKDCIGVFVEDYENKKVFLSDKESICPDCMAAYEAEKEQGGNKSLKGMSDSAKRKHAIAAEQAAKTAGVELERIPPVKDAEPEKEAGKTISDVMADYDPLEALEILQEALCASLSLQGKRDEVDKIEEIADSFCKNLFEEDGKNISHEGRMYLMFIAVKQLTAYVMAA